MNQTQSLQVILVLDTKCIDSGNVGVLAGIRGGTSQPAHGRERPGGCLVNWDVEGIEYNHLGVEGAGVAEMVAKSMLKGQEARENAVQPTDCRGFSIADTKNNCRVRIDLC